MKYFVASSSRAGCVEHGFPGSWSSAIALWLLVGPDLCCTSALEELSWMADVLGARLHIWLWRGCAWLLQALLQGHKRHLLLPSW